MTQFYSTKTLLACDPDTNTRYIYKDEYSKPLAVFNNERQPWTEQDAKEVAYLTASSDMDEFKRRRLEVWAVRVRSGRTLAG